eukprot:CAMPEP_0171940324 /NCGR_PEP_ID=MMETSP0993-20121228/36959_1 /TAXON_ID=483369 /ORGANISM="non described non described, Strain CCMP2098" /LENGTH=87 /DNA_ID=CAMNT_0012582313 /DNA_START=73 /DNA_END=332 /DNA_ORIENTATION=+
MNEGGSFDASSYLSSVRPIISTNGNNPPFAIDLTTNNDEVAGAFARPFSLFSAGTSPGSSFDFVTSVSGVQVGNSGGGGSTLKEKIR